jgi:hypothetical protein
LEGRRAFQLLSFVLAFAFERSTKIIRSIILPVLIYIRFFIYAWTLKAGNNSPVELRHHGSPFHGATVLRFPLIWCLFIVQSARTAGKR